MNEIQALVRRVCPNCHGNSQTTFRCLDCTYGFQYAWCSIQLGTAMRPEEGAWHTAKNLDLPSFSV